MAFIACAVQRIVDDSGHASDGARPAVDDLRLANDESRLVNDQPRVAGTTLSTVGGFAGANLALDGSYVYFADQKKKLVQKVAKAGGTPVTLANTGPATPDQVAVDSTYVYFTTCNGTQSSVIYRTPK